ncbi:MAG: TonB-dependent receptor, partial [Paramuribaculum sp.]|nr:TonB-dependent receptor [Paramuribaculum sp.]
EPLIGASVQPVGSNDGVSTDLDGNFTLRVPASIKEIKVSYIGMKSVTLPVSAQMRIVLEPASNMLETVIVTGYGSGKKLGSVVGAVNIVDDQVFEDTPSSNFVDALQGQVPGLNIFSNTGEPGALPSSVRIRGVSSLNASTTPLYILDGAPVTSSVFTTLSPSDIANVTVLKDAASTAIYGSRAANGVIVITTKKGQYGDKAKVSVKASAGFSQRADSKIEIMNSQQYIQFRDLVNAPVEQKIRDLVNNYNINTNWMDELVSNTAPMYSLEGRVQGGTDKVRYYLSLGHYDQEGLITNSGIRRETLRANIDSKVNNWLAIGFSGNLGYEKTEANSAAAGNEADNNGAIYTNNPFLAAFNLLPFDSPYYYSFDDNGNIIYGDHAEYLHYSKQSNPNDFNRLAWPHGNKTTVSAMLNLYEQITPLKGLTIRAQQALSAFDYRSSNHRPEYGTWKTPMGDEVTDWNGVKGSASESFQRYYQWTYTNTIEYKFNIADKHDFSVLAGQESVIQKNNSFGVSTSGQPNADQWLLDQGTMIDMKNVAYGLTESTINSWFFNLSYSFDNRYFLDASYRRDGSSKFAPNHRWANFYSIGLMWNIKNEKFMQDIKWLSDLKLRGNYGTTGNSGIGDYAYQGTVDGKGIYNEAPTLGLAGQNNNNLTWETVKQFDLGIDLGFLDNRLTLMADFYIKDTKDMLMSVPYSYTTGFTGGAANVGAMRNTGVDVDFGATIFRNKDWYVGANVNFNYNKLEIKELFNGLDKFTKPGTGITYEVGKNPFELHNVIYAGVDPRDGQQMWYTKDGNLTKHYSEDDEVALGKSYIAPWNGGFGVNARWKGISLRADFNWSAQKYIFNATNWYIRDPRNAVERTTNGAVELLNVWTKPGDVTDMPNRFDLYGQPQIIKPDSRFVEDASFMRLKNLTVSYSLPKKWMNTIKLSDITFHFTGRNLITITDFTGVDPEYQANVVQMMYPNTRQYEFGLEVTF